MSNVTVVDLSPLLPAVTWTELWKAGLINQVHSLFQAVVVKCVAGNMCSLMTEFVPGIE